MRALKPDYISITLAISVLVSLIGAILIWTGGDCDGCRFIPPSVVVLAVVVLVVLCWLFEKPKILLLVMMIYYGAVGPLFQYGYGVRWCDKQSWLAGRVLLSWGSLAAFITLPVEWRSPRNPGMPHVVALLVCGVFLLLGSALSVYGFNADIVVASVFWAVGAAYDYHDAFTSARLYICGSMSTAVVGLCNSRYSQARYTAGSVFTFLGVIVAVIFFCLQYIIPEHVTPPVGEQSSGESTTRAEEFTPHNAYPVASTRAGVIDDDAPAPSAAYRQF